MIIIYYRDKETGKILRCDDGKVKEELDRIEKFLLDDTTMLEVKND